MDISKLPKLSQTEAPPPPAMSEETPEPRPVMPYRPAAANPLAAAEAWVAAMVGLIFVYLGSRFGSYLLATLSGRAFHTGFNFTGGSNDGQEVPYRELAGHAMINDAAMFWFGVAVLLDALVIGSVFLSPRVRRPLLMVTLVTTVAATLFNLYVAGVFFKEGTLPLFSLLAVALGGYAAVVHWTMLKGRPGRATV